MASVQTKASVDRDKHINAMSNQCKRLPANQLTPDSRPPTQTTHEMHHYS